MNVCRSIISLCLTSYGRWFWCGSAKIFPLVVCCVCMYMFRHGHLNTACLPTAVLSNSACVCVSEAWGHRAAVQNMVFCQCVSSQTNLTHRSHEDSFCIHSLWKDLFFPPFYWRMEQCPIALNWDKYNDMWVQLLLWENRWILINANGLYGLLICKSP